MRTNYAGFALAVCMGLLVVVMGFAALSAAGLVGFSDDEAVAEQPACGNEAPVAPKAVTVSAYVPASAAEAATIAAGESLFQNNCTQCHAVNEKVVGPALAGIGKRRSIGWLVPWVHNPAKVIASGDAYAVKLYNDNGKQQMTSFPQLSDKDIAAIMAWVSSQEGAPSPEESATLQTVAVAR